MIHILVFHKVCLIKLSDFHWISMQRYTTRKVKIV